MRNTLSGRNPRRSLFGGSLAPRTHVSRTWSFARAYGRGHGAVYLLRRGWLRRSCRRGWQMGGRLGAPAHVARLMGLTRSLGGGARSSTLLKARGKLLPLLLAALAGCLGSLLGDLLTA